VGLIRSILSLVGQFPGPGPGSWAPGT